MSCHRPFCRITSLAAAAVAALVLLTPAQVAPARAQAAQQATLSVDTKSDSAKPPASQTTGAGTVAAVDQANTAQQVLESRVGAQEIEAGPHENRRVNRSS